MTSFSGTFQNRWETGSGAYLSTHSNVLFDKERIYFENGQTKYVPFLSINEMLAIHSSSSQT